MIKYTDIFELLDSGGNLPLAALFMTYGFDPELFEQHILPAFLGIEADPNENELKFRNQIALKLKEIPVGVISDAKQFNGGRTFLYDHVVVNSETFHPKCFMLLFKDFLRVIIASGNITKSGFCYNAELIWHGDLYLDGSNSISEELNHILMFMNVTYGLDKLIAVQEIMKFLGKCSFTNGFPKVLSTCAKQSVFSRILEELKNCRGKCKAITVLSPFYENDREQELESTLLMSFIDEVKLQYPNVKMKICFPANKQGEQYMVNAPVGIFGEITKKYKDDIGLFVVTKEWEREDGEPIPRTLHAKLIYAEFDNGYNLYLSGSVNFTNNAMRSNERDLRNIEIGVLNYTKSKLLIPNCTKVSVDMLSFVEPVEQAKIPVCFIDSAIYDGTNLVIQFNINKMAIPCGIYYNGHLIMTLDERVTEKRIINFSLKKPQDLKVVCKEYTFFVPILIPNKEGIETEDLKITFSLEMKDIIDYLAGKYKSLTELERLKKLSIGRYEDKTAAITVFFRQNLQRFFKALDALKQGLELPYYTETSFNNYISAPIGIKNLVNMILSDFKQGVTGEEETFLLLVEIWNVIEHIEYQDDWLTEDYKNRLLNDIMQEAIKTVQRIVKTSKGSYRNQYQVMLKAYGLVG